MRQNGKTIIYTDLDGSFLDEKDYSFRESLPALLAAQKRAISVVFCSSKTRAEIEHLRKATKATDPFIVENGAAIFVPDGYFPFAIEDSMSRDGYEVIELGESYSKLVDLFRFMRAGSLNLDIVGFSDLTDNELALECGMTLDAARRAKSRAYTEPFRFSDITPEKIDIFRERIRQSGRQFSVGGRYYLLHSDYDKGHAVEMLTYLYRRAYARVTTIGIGDSPNDAPMLSKVDAQIIVKRPSGTHHPELVAQFPQARLTEGIGPRGWAEAVMLLGREKD
ncbi:MAG: HAD-IIB family hydrolase [Acidobacteria bacterium]|nr:HAD-IIB family hydrolase [Acidobacteriota bacterium]